MKSEDYSRTQKAIQNAIVTSQNHPVLLVFTAEWISQSSIVEIVTQKIKNALPTATVITLDADKDEELFIQYNVGNCPSAIIIKNQKMIKKINGTFSKKQVLDAMMAA